MKTQHERGFSITTETRLNLSRIYLNVIYHNVVKY